ncbi:Putative Atypical/HISK protein kinase [Rhizopus microsporus]|nr:Putative Atypical/HISK protein kinase [Rhizopus microsporus]
MHDKPLEKQQLDHIACILKAVQRRVTNEISRLRQRDNLIVIKNAALQDAEYKLRFLADMSHEIRTPLNAVVALTDLLLQEKQSLNEEQVEHLQVIQTSGNHLLTVINDILDFSKMNHGSKFKLEYRKFSLRKCIKEDEQTVPQEDQNGRVVLEISVTDTGIGMPASRLPLLFKSFSQIDISTARKYGGTGLGLAISSMLVNRMGGGLWVESEEGVGSRFALTLPIAIAQDIPTSPSSSISSTESLCTPQTSEPRAQSTIQTNVHNHSHNLQHNNIPDTKSTASGLQNMISKTHRPETVPKKVQQEENLALEHPIKVLLAEDNILNQKIALSILKRLGYQDVTIASNGKEALDLILKQEFDVVFMDLYMPEMDGLEATRHIRQELKKNVYIIALTASASKQDRNICIESGMNDFISKPFTMTEMKAALRKVYTTK